MWSLISAVVDFRTLSFSDDNPLPYALYLPSYTATAHYHGALADDLQQFPLQKVVRRSERFAMNEYLPALMKGGRSEAGTPGEDRREDGPLDGAFARVRREVRPARADVAIRQGIAARSRPDRRPALTAATRAPITITPVRRSGTTPSAAATFWRLHLGDERLPAP